MSNRSNYKATANNDKKDYKFHTASGDLYRLYFTDFNLTNKKGDEFDLLSVGFSCFRYQDLKIFDINIRSTIVDLILSLFEDDGNTVIFYICPNNDGKAKFRNRIFNQWFNNYADEFDKHQIINDDLYTAIILKSNHPQYVAIIDAFEYAIKSYWLL